MPIIGDSSANLTVCGSLFQTVEALYHRELFIRPFIHQWKISAYFERKSDQ